MKILNILNDLVERLIMMIDIDVDYEIFYFSSSLMRCHLFWTPLFYLYDSKKRGQSVYIRTFGLGLPSLPIYAECPHRYVRTFAIFRKVITMVQD